MNCSKYLRLSMVLTVCALLCTTSFTRAEDLPKKFPVPLISYIPQQYVCYRSQTPIVIDGALDEVDWSAASWTSDFTDIEGSSRITPRFQTKVKMLWDEEYFYIAAWLQEPQLWATYDKRDMVIFHENDFEVFIDPDGDTHQYYEFEMNALNTVWDLLLIKPYRDGGPAVNAWDIAGLKTAVKLFGTINQPADIDSAWTLEIAFPWKVLSECAHRNSPPKDGDQWKVNFSRVQWRTESIGSGYKKSLDPMNGKQYPEDNWVWSPQGLVNMHYPEMWGVVQFSTNQVGTAKASIRENPDEKTLWQLRQVYYWQRNRQESQRPFSDNLETLKHPSAAGAKAYITNSGFEVTIPAADSTWIWHIDETGRTWQTRK
ncbi:MAG: carbohydrate-binding family 9-like protein [bacterium]|nr:carbohydrate-binding family 9-like protein [bacterium]